MKCPVCGKEMEKGGVGFPFGTRADNKLFWVPENSFDKIYFPTKKAVEKAGGKVFPIGRSIFDNEPRYSWYCRECEMVLIDTKNKR